MPPIQTHHYLDPLNILAKFRIILSLILLFSAEVFEISNLEISLDNSKPIFGVDWLFSNIGIDVFWRQLAQVMVYLGATLTLVGYWTRLGFLLILLGSGYIFALLQYHSFPVHIHHLWWFSFLLFFAPCAEKYSLTVWNRKLTIGSDSHHHVNVLGLCIGLIFFFPGWHKLLSAAWRSGEVLQRTILWKQAQYWDQSFLLSILPDPSFPIMAWTVIIFELSVIFILLSQRYLLFVVLAFGFHLGTWLFTGIVFSNIWPLYFAFLSIKIPTAVTSTTKSPILWWTFTPQFLLISGLIWAGFNNIQKGFPWISYPDFTQEIDHKMPLLSIHIIDLQMHKTIVPYQEYIAPNNREWGRNWRLAGLGYPVDTKKLEQYWKEHSTKIQMPETPFTIEFHLSKLDTRNLDEAPTSLRKLHSIKILKPVFHDSSMEQ